MVKAHCRNRRTGPVQSCRHWLSGQIEHVGGDGSDLRRRKFRAPAGHACSRDALGDEPHHVLWLAAVLPLAIAEIRGRRPKKAAGDWAVTAPLYAVTGGASTQKDRPPFHKEWVSGHLRRRGRDRIAQHPVRDSARNH